MADAGTEGLADLGREESERQTRDAIEAAIRALPEGQSDGVCGDCGSVIEVLRLTLLPGTIQCSACARVVAETSASVV